ncbi:MAG TPA: hypothetical protein VFE61_07625 [Candidatus Sulfotelmatobacter sp.]|nr:hypothetical protein [Candidatus Sulfotelmatobacter sp.]
MADEAAHLRSAAEFVPAVAGDLHDAHLLAAAPRSHTGSGLAETSEE